MAGLSPLLAKSGNGPVRDSPWLLPKLTLPRPPPRSSRSCVQPAKSSHIEFPTYQDVLVMYPLFGPSDANLIALLGNCWKFQPPAPPPEYPYTPTTTSSQGHKSLGRGPGTRKGQWKTYRPTLVIAKYKDCSLPVGNHKASANSRHEKKA